MSGYKSIVDRQTVEIAPLTVLAGANSSGKSSMMQPLLLLKQTLEVGYDPGAIVLSGPCLAFSLAEELLSSVQEGSRADSFSVELHWSPRDDGIRVCYKDVPGEGLSVHDMSLMDGPREWTPLPGMSTEETLSSLPPKERQLANYAVDEMKAQLEVRCNRCFLDVLAKSDSAHLLPFGISLLAQYHISRVIYLPGLRGNPARAYPVTGVSSFFPGRFGEYTASVLAHWQRTGDDRLEKVCHDLSRLGLASRVAPKRVNDVEVQLRVTRLPSSLSSDEYVSVADVGLGVSQALPVIVALHAADPGQMVYLERPEIHLHPRAQSKLVEVLADAARRGVRIVVETHSHLVMIGIQTLVAEGTLSSNHVKLHWFIRDSSGRTRISTADLDAHGSVGEWPEDFGDVLMDAQGRYIDAASSERGGH